MLGSCGGVAKLFKDRFPAIVIWPCASRRLELSVHDVIQEVSFLDKLYAMYYASRKNARQLQSFAASLEMEILKIGRIISTNGLHLAIKLFWLFGKTMKH
jgi:hypothetical protein